MKVAQGDVALLPQRGMSFRSWQEAWQDSFHVAIPKHT